MTIQRWENVGLVVDDLAAVAEFFVELRWGHTGRDGGRGDLGGDDGHTPVAVDGEDGPGVAVGHAHGTVVAAGGDPVASADPLPCPSDGNRRVVDAFATPGRTRAIAATPPGVLTCLQPRLQH